ncbi:uncharacterized protein LOC106876789 isoform X1 [Octopus bimaculoides]|uniref:Fibronectin type-III domain-containing protein n=1 Tax=Octopus bimaculoides TaxID=37653 RepID=A0A0L8GHP0_OCTBM|nr:uncharacterized protein LOC106876789 isoform X1 [Octopus bimaculoides]|eukprot:XP_014780983.1 PREDICTED: uncharacterized protein LOC106876789 isoform X1 [Octopus bimaculoides]
MHYTMAIFAHLHSFPIILLLCCGMVLFTDGHRDGRKFGAEEEDSDEDGDPSTTDGLLQLKIVNVKQNSALFSWFSTIPSRSGLVKCEVVSTPENKQGKVTEIMNSLPTNWTDLQLTELTNSTQYTVFIICSVDTDVYNSNSIQFITGVPLTTTVKPKPITSTPTPHTGPYLETANESQVTDVVLGVLFAVIGAVVISTSAFYLCKKYQRNQRILRFYREAAEVDTNPFGVIYVYFDDSTTNSNIGSD